jgi:SAM-dependent methyltransferase
MAGGYNPACFAAIAAAEDRHFWFRARNRALCTVLTGLRGRMPADARILEVGCGAGAALHVLEQVFPSASVVGMDLFAEGLRLAQARCRASLLQARIEAHPFGTQFDLVGIFDVLEHVDHDDRALESIRDLLAPGGSLALTVPAGRHLWSAFDVEAHHCRRYSRALLLERLDHAGFAVRYLTPFMTAVYPLVWFSRRVRPQRGPTPATATELHPPAWLNALMDAALRPERWVLRAGGRLPFGTSLLAIATRR